MSSIESPTIVGVCGPAGSGKDTVGDMLYAEMSPNARCISFAGPLYAAAAAAFGVPEGLLRNRETKELPHPALCGKSPRYVLQTLGTEWGRNLIDSAIWTRIAMQRAGAHKASGFITIITDVRFENEADAIREDGGTLLHISRPGAGIAGTHESEAGIATRGGDFFIINDGSLQDLEKKVKGIYAHLTQQH